MALGDSSPLPGDVWLVFAVSLSPWVPPALAGCPKEGRGQLLLVLAALGTAGGVGRGFINQQELTLAVPGRMWLLVLLCAASALCQGVTR